MLGPGKAKVLHNKMYSLRLSLMNDPINQLSTVPDDSIHNFFYIEYMVRSAKPGSFTASAVDNIDNNKSL